MLLVGVAVPVVQHAAAVGLMVAEVLGMSHGADLCNVASKMLQWRADLSCTYLAHHKPDSVKLLVFIMSGVCSPCCIDEPAYMPGLHL